MPFALLLAAANALVGPPVPVLPTVAGVPADGLWRAVAASPRLVCSRGTGTAVVVGVRGDAMYVLTADHVVAKATDFKLEFYDRDNYPRSARQALFGNLYHGDATQDLAVLKFPVRPGDAWPEVRIAPLGDRPRRFPAAAFAVGCNAGGLPTVEAVTVTAKRIAGGRKDKSGNVNVEDVAFFWETAQIPVPGRSGGPLFDLDGRVIGICAATTGGKGFYAHLDEIHALLKEKKLSSLFDDEDRKNR